MSIDGTISVLQQNPAMPSLVQRMRPLFGSFGVVALQAPAHLQSRAFDDAFAQLTHVEQCMHPTREGSDLQRLCAAPGREVRLDAATWEVLRQAKRLHRLSDGVFEPCLPGHDGGLEDLWLSDERPLACLARPAAIDLGGIAKGYAVDRAIDALRAAGCSAGCVNAGGDLRVFGAQAFEVQVRWSGAAHSPVRMRDDALAVSLAGPLGRPAEFRGYYVRGVPDAPVRMQAAVRATTAMVADAMTKCALLCAPQVLATLLRIYGAELLTPPAESREPLPAP